MAAINGNLTVNDSETDCHVLADLVRAAVDRAAARSWQISEGEFWTAVTPDGYEFQQQGWKIHVSATPLSAPIVLARCASVLLASGCAFKFARDLERVCLLVNANGPRGNSGKFITAYAVGDDHFRTIAVQLDEATAELQGPRILSDRQLAPGSLVHYRYGVTAAEPVLTNDGAFESVLVAPDGTTVPDKRLAWFSPPSWATAPFPDAGSAEVPARPGPVRLGNRFIVRRAITHSNRGGVYVATDGPDGSEVIIKQAREHVGSTLDGRDCRDDLRYEARMLDLFAPLGICPRQIALFEQQDSLFLAEELIPGTRLTNWVTARARQHSAGDLGPANATSTISKLAVALTDILATAHGTGLVLRDFNPNNLMVTPDEQLRLIDLECVTRPGAPVLRRYTPGFSAAEQTTAPRFGPAPAQEADLFSLGATLFYLAAGVAPDFPADVPRRRSFAGRLAELVSVMSVDNGELAALAPLILGLMDDDPWQRWPLARARKFLCGNAARPAPRARPPRLASRSGPADLAGMVHDGQAHLLRTMNPDLPRLWPSSDFGNKADPCSVQYGAGGVIAVLARTDRGADDPGLRAGTAAAAAWIADRLDAVPRVLPGLYFGRSGTAWALHDVARYLGDEKLASRAVTLAESVPVTDWGNPDITHGISGAGLAQLHLWQATGNDSLWQRTMRCADAVLGAARVRGTETLWPIPAEWDSQLAGVAHYGFAHGVAGAGTFLLYCGVAAKDENLMTAALSAGHTLSRAAVTDGGAARWPGGPGEDSGKSPQHWCNGAAGIGTFLIRLWHVTRDRSFLDLADAAAVTVVRQRWRVGNAACHGLAGDGEFLLDMAGITGEQKYLDWASQLADVLFARRIYIAGLAVAAGEEPANVTAAYNTGLAGVLGFLDRLLNHGPRLWMPDELLELS